MMHLGPRIKSFRMLLSMQAGPKFSVVFSVFQFILPVESLYPEEVSKLHETEYQVSYLFALSWSIQRILA